MTLVARPLPQGRKAPATCLPTDAVGDLVIVTAPPVAGVYQVTKIDVGAMATMPGVAIIVEKTTGTSCTIQFPGDQVKNVYTGLVTQRTYFAGADAQPTLVPPAPSLAQPQVYWQPVGVALDPDTLLFMASTVTAVRVL